MLGSRKLSLVPMRSYSSGESPSISGLGSSITFIGTPLSSKKRSDSAPPCGDLGRRRRSRAASGWDGGGVPLGARSRPSPRFICWQGNSMLRVSLLCPKSWRRNQSSCCCKTVIRRRNPSLCPLSQIDHLLGVQCGGLGEAERGGKAAGFTPNSSITAHPSAPPMTAQIRRITMSMSACSLLCSMHGSLSWEKCS